MQDIPTDLMAFIVRDGRELITDSRAVAIAFSKKHLHVLRTIRAMHASKHQEIRRHAESNFGLGHYADANGQQRPMYRMTAKGMSELAMSFTGDAARVVRIRFLNAFEEMAARIARQERSITEQMHALELREKPSIVKGQIGSRLMNERRAEKPDFTAQRAVLKALSQPDMFAHQIH